MTTMRRVTVLVCGEPMRGDDAVAEAVVRALPSPTAELADICRVGGLMPDDLLSAGDAVVVVDAVRGLPAGTVIDVPLDGVGALEADRVAPASSHALPLPAVVAIAEQLGGRRPEGRFVGVAGDGFTLGAALSPGVRDAIEPAAARLDHWIRVLAHGRRLPGCA